MSRYDRYDPKAREVLYTLQDIVRGTGRRVSDNRDVVKALLLSAYTDMASIARYNNLRFDGYRLKALYESIVHQVPPESEDSILLSEDLRVLLDGAEALADKGLVQTNHIIRAAWPHIKDALREYLITPQAPIPEDQTGVIGPSLEQELSLPELDGDPEKAKSLDFLRSVGRELGQDANVPEFCARQAEMETLIECLHKRYRPNPLLVGESGVGKSALIEGLAQLIAKGKVPERLKRARIFEVRVGDLAIGTTMHGMMEERVKALIQAAASSPDIILFIDELHQAAQAYSGEPVADLLKPALSSGKIRVIGATSRADYYRFLDKDPAFARRFQGIFLNENDRVETIMVLRSHRASLERHFGLSLPEGLMEKCYEASQRLQTGRAQPERALELLDRACAKALIGGQAILDETYLESALASMANQGAGASEGRTPISRLDALASELKAEVLSQDQAIDEVCKTVRLCKRGLDLRPERPDGAFLFTGPSGVGKTALALALARRLSGRDDASFKIDMSDFSESHSMARLIGAPPGYLGYGDLGLLAQAAEKTVDGVLILDEFEKAHPNVHRLFLQLLDTGVTTDSYGKRLDFSRTTVIATCNVRDGDGLSIGFSSGPTAQAKLPMAALRRFFPPELLGRFDALIPFSGLSRADCRLILLDVLLPRLGKRLSKEQGIELGISDALVEIILDEGYSIEFGARGLEHAFQNWISLPLAQELENLRSRSRLRADWDGEKTAFLSQDY